VNGQISGNSVILQLIGNDGLNAGQMVDRPVQGLVPLFSPRTGRLHSALVTGTAYAVNTKACPGVGFG